MIYVICEDSIKNDVKDYMYSELTKMYLHSVSYIIFDESTYDDEEKQLIQRGETVVRETVSYNDNNNGFIIDPGATDNVCFSLAYELSDENNYNHSYGHNEASSIWFPLQKVIDHFPGTTIKGTFVDQGNCYRAEYYIETRDKRIIVTDEDGKEYSVKEPRYNTDAFLTDALKSFSYDRFCDVFEINKEMFSEKMYKEFVLGNMLFRNTLLYEGGMTYEDFDMAIFLFVFEHDCVGITEEDYSSKIKEFCESMPDPDGYLL